MPVPGKLEISVDPLLQISGAIHDVFLGLNNEIARDTIELLP